ncbi:hypothetical protein Tco_0270869 [Tanacetum coccineum]
MEELRFRGEEKSDDPLDLQYKDWLSFYNKSKCFRGRKQVIQEKKEAKGKEKKEGGRLKTNYTLDSLLAQRIAEEEELNEQQKKRKAQVQFEAQHYTNEDWDLIRAKIEANCRVVVREAMTRIVNYKEEVYY